MDFSWLSFLIGGAVFLLGFLAIMAWIIPDGPARRAMSWIATRRNFSKVSLFVGIGMICVFVVMIIIAISKLLHYVQMAPWVWTMSLIGLGVILVSLIILVITRRRNVNP